MSKFFWMKICGANLVGGRNRKQILLEANFLEEIWGANFFLQVKFHSGKKRILGSKNVMERKDMGSKKIRGAKRFGEQKIWGGGGEGQGGGNASKIWEIKIF